MARLLNMEDILAFYEGSTSHPFLELGDMVSLYKAVGTVSTASSPEFWNRIYGPKVWYNLNTEANAWGMLPKITWDRSGWRAIVGWGLTNNENDTVVSEGGTIPDATYPEVKALYVKPAVHALTFEISHTLEELARVSSDDIWGTVDQLRMERGVAFNKMLNRQLLRRAIGSQENGSDFLTQNGGLIELDRIVSSKDEINSIMTTPDYSYINIYGVDRSTESWANSVVLHNSGTPRDLTTELILDLIANVKTKGANPSVFLTGPKTYAKIQALAFTLARFLPMSEQKVQFGLEGVKTVSGADMGIQVAAMFGIPIITSVDTPKDTIERIYLFDTTDPEDNGAPRLAISVVRPVEYFEGRDPVYINKFVVRGIYRIIAQTIARGLPFQGKIRDLQ